MSGDNYYDNHLEGWRAIKQVLLLERRLVRLPIRLQEGRDVIYICDLRDLLSKLCGAPSRRGVAWIPDLSSKTEGTGGGRWWWW